MLINYLFYCYIID